MSEYVAVRDGGKTSEIGAFRWLAKLFRPGYISGWATSQRGAGANMSVDIAVGDGSIFRSTDSYGYYAWSDAVKNVLVTAADATNPRLDILVAYIDKSVVSSASNDNPGALKFAIVAGTPAGSPTAPSAGTIQSTISASNPYIQLAQIAVAANASSIVNANVTDIRSVAALAMNYLYGGGSNTNGHLVPNVADDTVALLNATQTFLNKTLTSPTFSNGAILAAALSTGAILLGSATSSSDVTNTNGTVTQVSGVTATVTVPAGGRAILVVALGYLRHSNSGEFTEISIWDGAVVSGSKLGQARFRTASANQDLNQIAFGFDAAPTPGSKTYNLGFRSVNATGTATLLGTEQKTIFLVLAL